MIRFTLAALAFLSLSAFAHAQPAFVAGVPSIEVPYGDLNLYHPAGAATALGRVRMAAALVCGGRPDNREILDMTRFRACVSLAVQEAIVDLNAARASQFHAGASSRRTIVVTRR